MNRKVIAITLILTALTASACSTNEPTSGNQTTSDTEEHQNSNMEKENSNSSHNDEDAYNERETDQAALIQKLAQQEVTNFPFNLPISISVTKGKYLTVLTTSKEDYFEITFYESNQEIPANDPSIQSDNTVDKLARLRIQKYESQEQANEQISFEDFSKVGGNQVNLGYDIIGYQDAGAGSSFTSWNEGRWALTTRTRTDKSEEGLILAKKVVKFLEENTLPAPKEYGQIKLDVENDGTLIKWEEKQTVYTIDQVGTTFDAVTLATNFN